MTIVGWHASHEQLDPRSLLLAAQEAEAAGFQAAMCSDHFAPWSREQGESGFAWSWLGAALQATSLSFGVVNAPGQRYHPAIIAQAAATLAQLFPDRFWVALGSGELLNEHITGDRWPAKPEREARLDASVEVIRVLLRGEEVSVDGPVRVDRAVLYSRPEVPPALFAAAVSPATAARVAGWADGLITVNQTHETLREVVAAFREHGGAGKPTALQVHVSWAPTEEEALAIAHQQWRTMVFGPPVSWETATVEEFDRLGSFVRPEVLRDAALVSAEPAQHLAWLSDLRDIGFDRLYLHHVGKQQRAFIETFGREVVPQLAVPS